MRIKKLGHCCLLIEEANLRILTDPGEYSTEQNQLTDLDLVLITHEHPDHLHVDSVKEIIKNNPKVQIITNTAVGKILANEGIEFAKVEHGGNIKLNGLLIEGFGEIHDEIYLDMGRVQNTGYFLNNKLFYPGDALTDPGKTIEVLALPVCGPWLLIRDALNYAIKLKPKITFPVHDGMLSIFTGFHRWPDIVLPQHNIKFSALKSGDIIEA